MRRVEVDGYNLLEEAGVPEKYGDKAIDVWQTNDVYIVRKVK